MNTNMNTNINSFAYDDNGNIYLLKDDKIYMFEINKDDNVSLFEINPNKITINLNNEKKNNKKINKQNALHIKSVENAINEIEDMSDEEREQYTDIAEQYDMYKYNPEKRYYKEETYTIDSDDNIDERRIEIYENQNELIKICSEFDIPSFETLIINGNENSSNVIFRTEIINDQPLYRITIYTDGIIYLNIIGTKIISSSLNSLFTT